jgi:hypothetical protein
MMKQAHQQLRDQLGHYAYKAKQLSMKKMVSTKERYSVSMLAALSQDKVIATQILDGGINAIVFENFVYHTLMSVRADPEY